MIWIPSVLILIVVGGLIFWRIRRRRRPRMISLVALVREPVTFDPAILANLAGKAWNADLGDGVSEGADGFVVGDVLTMIMCKGEIFLVPCLPKPYMEDDLETAAEGIVDLRVRSLLVQHKAWFSCDALGVDGTTSEQEIVDKYRRLAKLFVQLLDENCLLIYLPESNLAYAINEDTEKALQADDPIKALGETSPLPIIEVSADDPRMEQAVQKAREAWPQFVAAYEAGAGETFSVKAPVTNAGHTEFIWISVTALEGTRVYGKIGNEPGNLGALKLGSKVSVELADTNDWCYLDPQGNLAGGFTIKAVAEAARQNRGQ